MRIDNIEVDVNQEEGIAHIELSYPRNNKVDSIQVGLSDVRSTDDLRIKYDFERDGWVIQQPRSYYESIGEDDYDLKIEWIESAFCPAWKYELDSDEEFTYKPK